MSDEEKPPKSEGKRSASDDKQADLEPDESASKFKVVADIHSGMVLVAPVGSDIPEEEGDGSGAVSEGQPKSDPGGN